VSLRLIPGAAPLESFPRWNERRLVARFGRYDEDLLDEFGGIGTQLVSQALADAKADPRVVVKAHELQLAVVLDPETENNQLSRRLRQASFNALDCALKGRFDNDHGRPRLERLWEYAVRTLEEERSRGTDAFLAPTHVAGGLATQGRQTELELQRLAHRYYVNEDLQEPPPGEPRTLTRRFLASGTFRIETLCDGRERQRLIGAYRELPGDLFWIRVLGLSDRANAHEIACALEFLVGLHLASDRQVVVVGPGNLREPILASGLSVASGFGTHEYLALPRERAQQSSGGFNFVAFHRALLRNVAPRETGDFAHRAFAAFPCACGHHVPGLPPNNGLIRRRHSAHCRIQEWFELGLPSISDAEQEMERRIQIAERGGRTLKEPAPFRAATFRAVRVGAERAREVRLRRSLG
jgi:hypothetical protein